jgi:hypothetical protein
MGVVLIRRADAYIGAHLRPGRRGNRGNRRPIGSLQAQGTDATLAVSAR